MQRRRVSSEQRARDAERRGVWPSVTLTVGITAVIWIAIAAVFGLGHAGIASFGGVGGGAAGFAVWVLIWIAMWAAITIAIGGGLAAAFRAWLAFYPRFAPRDRTTGSADDEGDDVKRMAVEEAEHLLRHPDDR